MTTVLTISGIHCSSCKLLISEVLKDVAGVTTAVVDESTGKVTVKHDSTVRPDALKREVETLKEYTVLDIKPQKV